MLLHRWFSGAATGSGVITGLHRGRSSFCGGANHHVVQSVLTQEDQSVILSTDSCSAEGFGNGKKTIAGGVALHARSGGTP